VKLTSRLRFLTAYDHEHLVTYLRLLDAEADGADWQDVARIPAQLRLENGRVAAHIPGMATIVQCNCGAEYRRTEEKFLVPHTGDAVCTVCGAALESWCESTHVPTYELIERPDRKPARG